MNNNYKKSAPIIVISGPSGCGKSSILKYVFENIEDYYFSISTTTRAPRTGETNGIEYWFTSQEEFKKDIEENQFLEYATVHGNYYGTSLKPVMEALNKGKIVIFDIDVQGFEIIKSKIGHLVTSIFLTTPTQNELKSRLQNRKTDSQEVIEKRLQNAKNEINFIDKYDFLVINDELAKASHEVLNIVKAASCKSTLSDKKEFLANWF
jgi:guanylate kinase